MLQDLLSVVFGRPADLLLQRGHLAMGALFLPAPSPLPEPFADLLLVVSDGAGNSAEFPARVLQILEGTRLAIAPTDLASAKEILAPLFSHAEAAPESAGTTRVFWGRSDVADAAPAPAPRHEPTKEEDAGALAAQIEAMTSPQRIQLAQKGDRTARMLLMKDKNKALQTFVLQNPRVTLDEVRYLAGHRQANPDALNAIAANRDWSQNAGVISALVRNPKTPAGTAVKLLEKVPMAELRLLAKSSDAPPAIQMAARKRVTSP